MPEIPEVSCEITTPFPVEIVVNWLKHEQHLKLNQIISVARNKIRVFPSSESACETLMDDLKESFKTAKVELTARSDEE